MLCTPSVWPASAEEKGPRGAGAGAAPGNAVYGTGAPARPVLALDARGLRALCGVGLGRCGPVRRLPSSQPGGRGHNYLTLVADMTARPVIFVTENHDRDCIVQFAEHLRAYMAMILSSKPGKRHSCLLINCGSNALSQSRGSAALRRPSEPSCYSCHCGDWYCRPASWRRLSDCPAPGPC